MEFQEYLKQAMQEEEIHGPRRYVERAVQDINGAIAIQKNLAKLSEYQKSKRVLGDLSNPLGRLFQ